MPEPGFLSGGGRMGSLMRSFDFGQTPLGPPDGWPESLRTAVSICLGSRFPMVVFWGPELLFLYNDGYAPMLGRDKHPLALGCPVREVWPEIWDTIGPMLASVLERGESTWAEDQLLLLDRNAYTEEAYFTYSFSPVRDGSGAVVGVFTAVTETTERVLSDRRLRTIAELAERTSGARTVDDVVARAREALAGNPDVPSAEIRVGECGDVPPGAISLSAGAGATLVAGVNPRRALDDRYREFFSLLAEQLRGALATARGFEGLAELDRAKTEFFANVSHEFRTPLTLLLGPLGDALAEPLPDAQRERIATARRSAQRLLRLVNALLDFSRLEAGRVQPALEPVDLGKAAAGVVAAFRSLVEDAGLELIADTPSVVVNADPELLDQILLNLLSNAFKFTFQGTIRVTVTPAGELRVADTGVGIPPAELPHVFERFHRVRETRGRSHEGSGIGLALVRELVEAQGGSVQVSSRLGEGTAFTVALPLATGTPATREARPDAAALADIERWGGHAARPDTAPAGAARILVADDNADMRDYLVRLLSPHFSVTAAGDGATALELAPGQDLVLADVMMPGLDGFELLKALREDPATVRLPVIMLSARAAEEAAIEGLDAGADEYLVKPFSANELIARVRSVLELARLRDARTRTAEGVAEALQRSLLPAELPSVPELRLAGRYVPAGHGLKVGGDWYDAVPLPDGRVVLAIGDVAGHGVRAAAVMGQISHALRAYAREGHTPAKLMRRLDALVLSGGLDMTTCLCAVLVPATGELRWANAGHLPPFILGGDRSVRRLDGPLSNPLGVVVASQHREGETVLADGDTLVLYTDGLVERRGESIDAGLERLAAVLQIDPGPDAVLKALLGDGENADDVALLVAHRARVAGPAADLTIPAHPVRLRDIRRWLEAWLRGNGIEGTRAEDLVLAVHEAGMNAVEHAYGLAGGTVDVHAERSGTRVEVEVRDSGRWRGDVAGREERGRGELLMRRLVDTVEIEHTGTGTSVRLEVKL